MPGASDDRTVTMVVRRHARREGPREARVAVPSRAAHAERVRGDGLRCRVARDRHGLPERDHDGSTCGQALRGQPVGRDPDARRSGASARAVPRGQGRERRARAVPVGIPPLASRAGAPRSGRLLPRTERHGSRRAPSLGGRIDLRGSRRPHQGPRERGVSRARDAPGRGDGQAGRPHPAVRRGCDRAARERARSRRGPRGGREATRPQPAYARLVDLGVPASPRGEAMIGDRVARLATYLEGREEAFVERLGELVAVDSGTGSVEGVNRVLERCADWLRTDGWSVERHAVHGPSGPLGNLVVAEQEGGGSGTTLVIGHTDTVFSDGTAAARPLRLDGDRILGPGVCDMKGGLVSGILAVEALRSTGTSFGRVLFVLNPDEEAGSPASRPFIRERAAHADAVFVLEAARENGAVVTARKGITNARMEFAGRAAGRRRVGARWSGPRTRRSPSPRPTGGGTAPPSTSA